MSELQAAEAAIRTLHKLGYTYNAGAELWKPPLGPRPDLEAAAAGAAAAPAGAEALIAESERLAGDSRPTHHDNDAWALDAFKHIRALTAALRAAEQRAGEPVAWVVEENGRRISVSLDHHEAAMDFAVRSKRGSDGRIYPLYAAPVAAPHAPAAHTHQVFDQTGTTADDPARAAPEDERMVEALYRKWAGGTNDERAEAFRETLALARRLAEQGKGR